MRRKDREVTEIEKMLEIMKNCDCCRLGLVDNLKAYIVPMNFGIVYENEKISLYFHSAKEGNKINLIENQPEISFEMDSKHQVEKGETACEYSYFYQSIMGFGKVSFIEDISLKKYALQKIMEHYEPGKMWEFNDSVVKNTVVMRLDISNWTCKEH